MANKQTNKTNKFLLFEKIVYRINTIPQVAEANRGSERVNDLNCFDTSTDKAELLTIMRSS